MKTISILVIAALMGACADTSTMTPEERAQRAWAIQNASIGLQNMGAQIYANSQPRPVTYTNCYRTMMGVQCSSW